MCRVAHLFTNTNSTFMKKLFPILFFVIIMILQSCSKDNCNSDVEGSYTGTESCSTYGEDTVDLTITSSTAENEVILTYAGTIFYGTLTDCNSIIIEEQTIAVSGISGSVKGNIIVNDNLLSGSITLSLLDIDDNCTWSMTRR